MILSRAGEVEGDICISERDRVTPGGWLQRSRGFFGPWTLQAPCLSFPIQTVCDAPVGETVSGDNKSDVELCLGHTEGT